MAEAKGSFTSEFGDRRRDLIIHGPASHRTCPDTTDGLTEDELEHHNYHHPYRGGTAA